MKSTTATSDLGNSMTRQVALWRRALLSDYFIFWLSLAYFLAMAPFVPGFVSRANLGNILASMLPLLIVALGQTIVLISGGIDLSVTSIVAIASVAGAKVMSGNEGLSGLGALATPCGMLAMIMVGGMVGLLNGTAIIRFQMPPFMVTLTSMMFFSGLAIFWTHSKNIFNLPPAFNRIGANTWIASAVALLALLLGHLLLTRTLFGRWVHAVGYRAPAARISGVPVNRVLLITYIISGVCAAVASMLYTGRLETGSPVLGQRILLDVIGATVIGGTSLFGGRGKVIWTVFGVLFLALIDNSLNLLNLSYFSIMMVKGGIILLAAINDAIRNKIKPR